MLERSLSDAQNNPMTELGVWHTAHNRGGCEIQDRVNSDVNHVLSVVLWARHRVPLVGYPDGWGLCATLQLLLSPAASLKCSKNKSLLKKSQYSPNHPQLGLLRLNISETFD